jgi:CubicO group peptidase (beta-lactamase class C family)
VAIAKFLSIRIVAGLIIAVGAGALLLDVATDNNPEPGTDHYSRIDSYVKDQLDDSRIPGASIAIVEDGNLAHAAGFGEDGRGTALTPETPFWIGSLTKSFTALAIMQLVEAGTANLDTPVQRYLPDFRVANAETSSQITVRHLLNQTSGFSRTDGVRMVAEGKEQSLSQAVAHMANVSLNRPVGRSYEYSNLNYVVLGRLVEIVSGERWQDFVQRHILDPLDMTRTYTNIQAAEANGLTDTYRFAFGLPIETEGEYLEGLAPTGYLYSTAGDMARYLTMYLQGGELDGARVLSEAGIAEMLRPNTDVAHIQLQSQAFDVQYAEGWFVGPFGAAEDARWHQGSLPFFTAWMILLPDTEQGVVVLINAGNQFEVAGANAVFSRIPQGVVNVLRGETPPSGISITRFFIIFDALVALVIALQVWSLLRVSRREAPRLRRDRRTLGAILPLTWELGLAALILIAFPSVIGFGWEANLFFVPDLTLFVLAVSLLWLATGSVRVGRLLLSNLAQRRQYTPESEHGASRTALG